MPGWLGEEGDDEASSPEGWVGLVVEIGISELDVAPWAVQAPAIAATASRMAA